MTWLHSRPQINGRLRRGETSGEPEQGAICGNRTVGDWTYLVELNDVRMIELLHNLHFAVNFLQIRFVQSRFVDNFDSNLRNQSGKKTLNFFVTQCTDKPINQSTEQSINQMSERTIRKSINQSIDRFETRSAFLCFGGFYDRLGDTNNTTLPYKQPQTKRNHKYFSEPLLSWSNNAACVIDRVTRVHRRQVHR